VHKGSLNLRQTLDKNFRTDSNGGISQRETGNQGGTVNRLASALAVTTAAAALLVVPAVPANATQDTRCVQAGMAALKSAGLFSQVARSGLPIATAVSLGVTPRPGTDVSALPDRLPLSVVLADHRAGDHSLFSYPWC
jgi:hypothetical protein